MTPTQAQIEAAAVELSNEHPRWPWECCLEIAKMYLLKHGYCEEIAALTAAAEAGHRNNPSADWAKAQAAYAAADERTLDTWTENYTIERCAQVAEARIKNGYACDAVAAIRALKEKP